MINKQIEKCIHSLKQLSEVAGSAAACTVCPQVRAL